MYARNDMSDFSTKREENSIDHKFSKEMSKKREKITYLMSYFPLLALFCGDPWKFRFPKNFRYLNVNM